MYKKSLAVILFLASLLLMFSIAFIKNPFSEFDYYGLSIDVPAPDFNLVDMNNEVKHLRDFNGKYVYLMFGYLNCNKTCHSQALILNELSNNLADDNIHFVYISMDPERDDLNKLKIYFQEKNDKLTVLRGNSLNQIQSIANNYKAPFSVKYSLNSKNIEINHPGYIFLITPDGQLSMVYSGSVIEMDRLQQDFIKFKAHYS